MPGHDIVVVEGYRKSGLPSIEIMRSGNTADANVARVFVEGAKRGFSLETDFAQFVRGLSSANNADDQALIEAALEAKTPVSQLTGDLALDVAQKMPASNTVAVVTDIPEVVAAAQTYGIQAFPLDDIKPFVNFIERY